MKRLAWNAVAVLAAAVLAGCQPATPTPPSPTTPVQSPTSVPTPTYLCTPEAGGDEAPCSEIEYEEMKAKDALYAEAEAVYREFFAESVRISRDGGVDEPTQVLLRTTTGDYLDNMLSIFSSMRSRGVKAEGEDPQLTVSRLPGVAKAGSLVALSVCIDSRGWAFFVGSERTAEGRVGVDEVYLARFGDDLKIIGADGREEDECGP